MSERPGPPGPMPWEDAGEDRVLPDPVEVYGPAPEDMVARMIEVALDPHTPPVNPDLIPDDDPDDGGGALPDDGGDGPDLPDLPDLLDPADVVAVVGASGVPEDATGDPDEDPDEDPDLPGGEDDLDGGAEWAP
ncbi:hypothetical protein [Corynebacterium sphenisci]|uniref:hypothetical protein n=1 Tax=Corynebacterium sphenisci TaxID=191493 RepID=UPI0026E0306B|nr:hypothetical protein [Corynebacterium sphenisci]MDO5730490.1 hypothetical protein [Corynebacterium sphenisci]